MLRADANSCQDRSCGAVGRPYGTNDGSFHSSHRLPFPRLDVGPDSQKTPTDQRSLSEPVQPINLVVNMHSLPFESTTCRGPDPPSGLDSGCPILIAPVFGVIRPGPPARPVLVRWGGAWASRKARSITRKPGESPIRLGALKGHGFSRDVELPKTVRL
jgi:hypothetical protein